MNFVHVSILLISVVNMSLATLTGITNKIETTIQEKTMSNSIQFLWRLIYNTNVTFGPKTAIRLPVPTRLTTPSIEEAQAYVHYAAASYCTGLPLLNWTCSECRATGSSVKFFQFIRNRSNGTQGFFAIDKVKQELIIAFRGTHNLVNVIDEDLPHDMISSPLRDGAKVHRGFMKATMSLYPKVLPILRNLTNQNPGFRVVLTGHSLGGAMATLTYYMLSHDLPTLNYAVFTYGQPRVGDKAFVDIINARPIPFARVVNENDVFPHGGGPASLGFVHHQTEYWTRNGRTRICSRDFYEDPKCSISLRKEELTVSGHSSYMGVSATRFYCLLEKATG